MHHYVLLGAYYSIHETSSLAARQMNMGLYIPSLHSSKPYPQDQISLMSLLVMSRLS